MPNCEPDTIALFIPDTIGPGPRTLIKTRFGDAVEVVFPVNLPTIMRMVADWDRAASAEPDPRGAAKDVIITAFQRGEHLSVDGTHLIATASVYLAWTAANAADTQRAAASGGSTIVARVTNVGGANYRFSVGVE